MKRTTSKGTVVVLVLFVFSQCVAAPLEYTYSIEAPQKVVTKPGIVNEGSTKEFAYWRILDHLIKMDMPGSSLASEK